MSWLICYILGQISQFLRTLVLIFIKPEWLESFYVRFFSFIRYWSCGNCADKRGKILFSDWNNHLIPRNAWSKLSGTFVINRSLFMISFMGSQHSPYFFLFKMFYKRERENSSNYRGSGNNRNTLSKIIGLSIYINLQFMIFMV